MENIIEKIEKGWYVLNIQSPHPSIPAFVRNEQAEKELLRLAKLGKELEKA